MDPTRWQRIKGLFARAINLPAPERAAFLQSECAGDEAVLREVEALLREHPQSAAPPARTGGMRVATGTVIGPYKLLEEIGEGGFGVVYLAQQEAPLRRRVALKVLKPGMDSRQVVARFEQERQALAMMDHPNIAQVFDGGATDAGQPFFVMELVRGEPITDYCDRERLDTRARLGLLTQVCRAIQHAHQKGVIHRDLKPSNVLVTIVDGQPTPKVIDFGVAKATQERLTSATLFTEHRQMLGTPLYMSPEQAALSGTDVDTRSDVYSLGVLLYELLTGATPFDRQQLLQAGLAEMQRVILEVEPQKPSTRASALSRTNATVAAQRRVEAARLGPLLRGDLDWIAMKCLEKERARRYETALELAQDVERHLDGEPVQAAPPSTLYRLRKFVRRNRQFVASACLLAGIASAGVIAKVEAEQNRANEAIAANQRQQFGDYCARIEAAAAAIQQDDIGRARELLDDCPEPLRNMEWRLLDASCDQSLWVGRGHTGEVTCVTFTPDGTRVVSGSEDATVRVWHARTGQPLSTLPPHDSAVKIVAISSDGSRILSKDERGVLRVSDLATGQLRMQAEGLMKSTGFARFCGENDDGVVAQTVDGVGCWDAATGAERWRIGDGVPCERAAVSLDLRYVVVITDKKHEVRLWDRHNEAHSPANVLGSLPKSSVSLEWHPEDDRFVAASADGTSIIWRAGDLVPFPFRFAGSKLSFAGWSMDGHGLAHAYENGTVSLDGPGWYGDLPDRSGRQPSVVCGPDDRMVTMPRHTYSPRLWTIHEVDSPPTMVPLLGHTDAVHTAAFSADGTRIATGSVDHTVRLWTTLAIEQPSPIPELPISTTSLGERFVRFSESGNFVAFFENNWAGAPGSRLELWDTHGMTPTAIVHVMPDRIQDVALDEQGRLLAVAMCSKRDRNAHSAATPGTAKSIVRLFHAEDGTSLPPDFVSPPNTEVKTCRFAVDGRSLLATCTDHSLLVWDVPSRKLLRHLEPEAMADSSALGPRWFAVHLWASEEVQILDPLGIEPPRSMGFCDALHGFSVDGGSVVTITAPRTIELRRLDAGPPISMHLPTDGTLKGAIRASGTCVLVVEDRYSGFRASADLELSYWDLANGQRLGNWPGNWSARFTADGTRILATDGLRIMIVDARTGRRVVTWKHRLGTDTPWPSPDGRSFVVASEEDSEAWMWSTEPFAVRAQAASDLAAAKSRLQQRVEAIATKNLSVADLRTKVAEWRLEDPSERRAATLLLGEFVDQRLVEVERVADLRLGTSVEDAQKAVGLVAAALDDFPGELTMRRLLGMLHYRAGRPADAVAMLTPEVTNDPETKYATSQWLVLAMAHARLGDREAALAAMERVDRTRDDARELLAEAEALLAATFPK